MTNAFHPLRIAVVSSSLKLAGAEKQTAYLTRALFEAGANVRFFHLGEGGFYEKMLREMGVPLHQIYRPNRPLFILARLSKALRRFRPEIVYSPQFGDLLQAGIAGRLCKALILGGVRSDGFYELNGSGRRSSFMLWLAHGLVANSHRAWHNLATLGAEPTKIKILPNVLDLVEFDARAKSPPPISCPAASVMAVAVGNLHPCKRFDRFLKALAVARHKAPSLLGVLAGADCGCRTALERQANELGLGPDRLTFVGQCDNIPALLSQAGFLVLCSEYEGFPNVILEAMAAGLPVITTPVGDAERIVIEDQTGYVVEGPDVETMAARMAELARSSETRARLGRAARLRVAGEYNYELLPARLLAIFREFAEQSRKRRVAHCLPGAPGCRNSLAGLPNQQVAR